MNRPLGLGVVGAGSIGIRGALMHMQVPDVHDKVKAVAVCDPVPGRAKAAAEKYGAPRGYETLEELLKDSAVDAVTICSPIGLHFDQGMAALRAGKHIHFNKTMTTTAAEATQLIDEAKKRNLRIVASPGQMISPAFQKMRELIKEGALGKLVWAAVGSGFGTYHEEEGLRSGNDVLSNINPAWYWKKPGGGPLYDMTVYGLHSLTGIVGPAKRVMAMSGIVIEEREFRGEKYKTDMDDNTLMVVDFGNNFFAFVYGTAAGSIGTFGSPNIYGTKGSIAGMQLNGKQIDWEGRAEAEAAKLHRHFSMMPHVTGEHKKMEEHHVFEDTMQLVDWVREGTPSVATAEHARHVIEIIEAGYKSAASGKQEMLKTTF